ncbi:rna-directed dna polymerase from mobile element jockey-like [Pitangus sulphuratus]|nr:rna-directed dna polymerase from mobile element jockey-like [Pitangus sulphuratus]
MDTQWIRNYLDWHTQRAVVNASVSKWRPGTNVHQHLGFEPSLFDIFIADMNSGIECTLGKFANDTKLCGVIDTLEERDGMQRDLDKPESPETQQYSGLHQKKRELQVKGAPPLWACETPPGALQSAANATTQEGHGPTGAHPEEAMKMIRRMEHLSCDDSLRELGLFCLEKTVGRP